MDRPWRVPHFASILQKSASLFESLPDRTTISGTMWYGPPPMSRYRTFGRESLIEAFAEIGTSAAANGTRIELTAYDGSAMLLASNFRFATEDVDIAELGVPWPMWLDDVVSKIAIRNQWSDDWINEAVSFYLSPLATRAADHLEFALTREKARSDLLSLFRPQRTFWP